MRLLGCGPLVILKAVHPFPARQCPAEEPGLAGEHETVLHQLPSHGELCGEQRRLAVLWLAVALVGTVQLFEGRGDKPAVVQVGIECMAPFSLAGKRLFANDAFGGPGRDGVRAGRVVEKRPKGAAALLDPGCRLRLQQLDCIPVTDNVFLRHQGGLFHVLSLFAL